MDIEWLFNSGWRRYDWNPPKYIYLKFVQRKTYFCTSNNQMNLYISNNLTGKPCMCCFLYKIHFDILHTHQHRTTYNFKNMPDMNHLKSRCREDKNMWIHWRLNPLNKRKEDMQIHQERVGIRLCTRNRVFKNKFYSWLQDRDCRSKFHLNKNLNCRLYSID